MEIGIPCGREEFRLVLPPEAEILESCHMPAVSNPELAVEAVLRNPIDSLSLAELSKGRKSACVVISDVTRPVPNRVILPPLLSTLESAGMDRSRITILIATGTHRPNVEEELVNLVGDEIAANYRVVNHDCRNARVHRRIGELEGAPIEINSIYLDADLKILTGLIEPHPYAGYSGGAKSILPGLSSFETMKFMHSFKMITHREVANCILEGNPFHRATLEAARLAGVDFVVNAVINKEKRLAGIFAGSLHGAHRGGCRMVEKCSIVGISKPADLVVTSGGGAPIDATFYQCGKGLLGAKAVVRPGGAVIMLCGCEQGIGSDTFTELVGACKTMEAFSQIYADPENFVTDQWAVQSYLQVLQHMGPVFVYSPRLTKEQLSSLGVQKIYDVRKELDALLKSFPRVAAIPEGPYVVGLRN